MLKEPGGHLGEAALHLSALALASDPRVCPVGVIAACLTLYLAGIGDKSRRAAAGRAELLAKKGHTGRVQNPAKVSENRPACGTAQHTLAVCFVFEKLEKSRKFLVKIWRKFSKILAKFWQFLRKFRKNQQKFQQFLTKILRLKNGAKECIV